MRLWHYKIIHYLPDSQLIAQWRELNSIFRKQDKHILINYIYEYSDEHLHDYSLMVIEEMRKRGISIHSFDNFNKYFKDKSFVTCFGLIKPFPNHHNNRYLLQCFYNLQEKYDRGQKDFRYGLYLDLEDFIKNEIHQNERRRL